MLPLEGLGRNLLWLLPALMADGILCFAFTSLQSLPREVTLPTPFLCVSNLPLPSSYKICGMALREHLRIQNNPPSQKL